MYKYMRNIYMLETHGNTPRKEYSNGEMTIKLS